MDLAFEIALFLLFFLIFSFISFLIELPEIVFLLLSATITEDFSELSGLTESIARKKIEHSCGTFASALGSTVMQGAAITSDVIVVWGCAR